MAYAASYASGIDYGDDEDDSEDVGGFMDRNAVWHNPNCQRAISAEKYPRSPFLHTETCTCGASDDMVALLRKQIEKLEIQAQKQFEEIVALNSRLPAHQPVLDGVVPMRPEPTQLALGIADPGQMAMDLDGDKINTEPPTGCSCHPDDDPPDPCPRKHALTECREAAKPALGIIAGTDFDDDVADVDEARNSDLALTLTIKDLNRIESLLMISSRPTQVDKEEAIELIRRKVQRFDQEPVDDKFLAVLHEALSDIPVTYNWASHYREQINYMLLKEAGG